MASVKVKYKCTFFGITEKPTMLLFFGGKRGASLSDEFESVLLEESGRIKITLTAFGNGLAGVKLEVWVNKKKLRPIKRTSYRGVITIDNSYKI